MTSKMRPDETLKSRRTRGVVKRSWAITRSSIIHSTKAVTTEATSRHGPRRLRHRKRDDGRDGPGSSDERHREGNKNAVPRVLVTRRLAVHPGGLSAQPLEAHERNDKAAGGLERSNLQPKSASTLRPARAEPARIASTANEARPAARRFSARESPSTNSKTSGALPTGFAITSTAATAWSSCSLS